MKQFFTFLVVVMCSASAFAQINAYYVLGSSGGVTYSEGNKNSLSTTIGEAALVQTFSGGKHILTQGFQQGSYIRTAIVALPVKLLSFDGYNKGAIDHLEWETASEINNAGFEVERLNAQNEFESIGYVQGKGNSNDLSDYTFDDEMPLQGENYYRLKQVDIDGNFTYSNTISMYDGKITTIDISAYPMPVTDALNIVIHNTEEATASVVISNMMGEVVYQQPLDIYEGTTVSHIDMSSYVPGQYFARLTTGATTKTIHLVRQ